MKSALRPEPWKPGKALPASLGLHVAAVICILFAANCAPRSGPMFDPDEVMEVSLAALPKAENMPQKEAIAAPPTSEVVKTDSELVKFEPDAPPPSEFDAAARQRIIDRQKALAALGQDDKDRQKTSAEGVEGAVGTSSRAIGNPILAAWMAKVRGVVVDSFNPLQDDPDLETVISVKIDRTGAVLDFKVSKASGNPSFDNAAARAVRLTPEVPAPPPEIMPNDEDWFLIRFRPEDAR
ncbi:MAG TPA: energy transducer TonB [Myxococcota bacterium]|nr:energy transducer TonB [Myxococcota bacterium]